MYQFLQRGLEILRKEFNELRTVSADHLMYIKEDLIIPHHYTFYDFIVNKVMLYCLSQVSKNQYMGIMTKEFCLMVLTLLSLLKARGKSGPLFHFDVRDDVRLVSDASVEKEESHAGEQRAS